MCSVPEVTDRMADVRTGGDHCDQYHQSTGHMGVVQEMRLKLGLKQQDVDMWGNPWSMGTVRKGLSPQVLAGPAKYDLPLGEVERPSPSMWSQCICSHSLYHMGQGRGWTGGWAWLGSAWAQDTSTSQWAWTWPSE